MRIFAPLLLLAVQTLPVFAADLSYAGRITADDDKRQFTFTLKQPARVVIRTYSYAGGKNAAGAQVARGGFDPTISVFDSTGILVALNRDGDCSQVSADSVTSFCFDSYIEQDFPAGTWQVVLTQSENLPKGPAIEDSFCYDGSGNFTAGPEGDTGHGFWDFFPNHRTGEYALDIKGVDSSSTPVNRAITGIVNSGSFSGGLAAPNTILTLMNPELQMDSSVTVNVGGLNAQVLYAAGPQINFVVPSDAKNGDAIPLTVLRGKSVLFSTSIAITDAFPALFTVGQTGTGQAAALDYNESGGVTLNGDTAPAVPAQRGSYIAVYGTGFGAANSPGADGLAWLAGAVTATVGGVPAQVSFAGIAPQSTMGLQQFNVLIPPDAPTGSKVPLKLQLGQHSTQSGTTVAIQ